MQASPNPQPRPEPAERMPGERLTQIAGRRGRYLYQALADAAMREGDVLRTFAQALQRQQGRPV